jgi:hypothetical protein
VTSRGAARHGIIELVLPAVILGLIAAFVLAVSASLQQHAAREAIASKQGDDGDLPVGPITRALPLLMFIKKLIRTPLWFYGWLTNVLGYLIQGAALHFGSVALVQPLLATQLLFVLPLGSMWNRCWPLRRDWLSMSAIVGGIAVFLAVRGTAPLSGEADRPRVILAGLITMIVVASMVAVAARRRPAVHATVLAVATGLCSAMSAVLMKMTADDLVLRGVAATARDWPGYALAFSTLCGLVLGQEAFASGSLAAAVSATAITNPVASYLIGVLAFHVAPPTGSGQLAAVAGAGLLLVIGTLGLAHSPTVQREVAPNARHQEELRAPLTQHSPSAGTAR